MFMNTSKFLAAFRCFIGSLCLVLLATQAHAGLIYTVSHSGTFDLSGTIEVSSQGEFASAASFAENVIDYTITGTVEGQDNEGQPYTWEYTWTPENSSWGLGGKGGNVSFSVLEGSIQITSPQTPFNLETGAPATPNYLDPSVVFLQSTVKVAVYPCDPAILYICGIFPNLRFVDDELYYFYAPQALNVEYVARDFTLATAVLTACGVNEYVSFGSCEACPAGTTNAEGDDPSGDDTSCDAILCQADEFVFNNACESCDFGYTNAEGDDASGEDTSCAEVIECAGFEPPMGINPVRVKKNRALPLKAELFDAEGIFAKTDADFTAPPVVQVMLDGAASGEGDVSDDVLPAGQGYEGNQFVFTDDSKWQFNLKTKNYSAPGTYIVSMESGDPDAYEFVPQCVAQFEIQ